MVGTIEARRARVRNVFAVVAALAITVAAACGSDDPTPAVAPTIQPTTTPAPTSAPAPTPTPETVLETVAPVVPAVEPEAGSDEAAILDVLDRVVRAARVGDIDSILENCDPTTTKLTPEGIDRMIGQIFFRDFLKEKGKDFAGFNYRNVAVRVFDDGTAITSSDQYTFDELDFEGIQGSYHSRDGNWYPDSFCHIF